MNPPRRLISLAPLLTPLALLVACGGGGGEPSAPPAPTAAPAAPILSAAASSLAAPPPPAAPNPNGLTRPVKLSGDPPRLPAQAQAHSADSPRARARCTITRAGAVEDCKILEAPPATEPLVLAALGTWRYRPALLRGEPIASQNVIEVAFAPPDVGASGASGASGANAAAAPPLPAPLGSAPPPGTPIPFDATMNRPTLLGGNKPDYTPEARAAGLEGTVVARCVITSAGKVRDCKVIKSLKMLDQAVLDALATQTYTPVVSGGKAIDVLYTMVFKFKLN